MGGRGGGVVGVGVCMVYILIYIYIQYILIAGNVCIYTLHILLYILVARNFFHFLTIDLIYRLIYISLGGYVNTFT